jgi:hypothetical protein
MKPSIPAYLALAALSAGLVNNTWAQQHRASPHDTISTVIDGNRVTIVYGRPYTKNPRSGEVRKIWGSLIPYDHVWRMGADEATLLITQKPITMGGVTVPAGAYTLFLLPRENGATQLIINKQLGQWGLQHSDKEDLGRADMTRETLSSPVDQFTMAIDKSSSGGGSLILKWETTQFSVPFTVVK